MVWDFNTREGLRQYVDEFGMEKLRETAAGNQLNPNKRDFVRAWIVEQDQIEAQRDQRQHAQDAISEAKRSADAAEDQAKTSAKALTISCWALGFSIVAMLAAVAQAIASFK